LLAAPAVRAARQAAMRRAASYLTRILASHRLGGRAEAPCANTDVAAACPASHSGNKESKTDDGGRTVRLSSTLRHPLFAIVPQMASFNSLEARNATFLLALI
jgi:hypothetical protein